MNIKDILKSMPNEIAKFYKHIYIINKQENEFYEIDYQGNKTKVGKKQDYKEIENKLSDYNKPVSKIINTKKGIYTSKVHGDDLILMDIIDDYRIIYIINLIPKKKINKDKIIVADDSIVITKFIEKLFNEEYEVLVAHDGTSAIKLIESNNLENIVGCFIDLNMPISNGYDVLDYFKKNNLFKKIPVSVISGEDDVDSISKLIVDYDIVDMLQKPFNQASAKNLVSKTINYNK